MLRGQYDKPGDEGRAGHARGPAAAEAGEPGGRPTRLDLAELARLAGASADGPRRR